MTTKSRVFCIGLDGGTFDLIEPWMRQGLLPNICKLVEHGVCGELRSVILPFTPQAWGSFMTGMNPGNHGVFGFKEKTPGKYSFQFVNNKSIRSKTLWQYLTEHDKASILVNIPMTYPAEVINGIIVGGMDAPGVDSDFTYPSGIKDEIFNVVNDYIIHLHVGAGYLDSDTKRRVAVDELLRMVAGREKLVLHFIENKPWDFFAVNFSAIDQVQHHFWRYMNGDNEFKNAVLRIHQRVDAAIGRILERLPGNTTVLMMSDHGSGAASPYVFFIDEWLREKRLLQFDTSLSLRRAVRKLAGYTLSGLSRKLSSDRKDLLMRMFPGLRAKSQGYVRRSLIDWPNTKAFSGEHPSTVRINLRGREAKGIVELWDYEPLRADIISQIESLTHPETGVRMVRKVYRREELYSGTRLDSAPDLIIEPTDFAHQVRGGPYSSKWYKRVISDKDPKEFFVNGVHRINGIFGASGPQIKKGAKLERPANIYDLFPTILYCLGLDLPEGLDGQVVDAIFEAGVMPSRPIKFKPYDLRRDGSNGGQTTNYDQGESDKIEESLRGLGYVD